MLTGAIASLVSAEPSKAQALAASVAKLNDKEPLLMYYKKLSEEKLLSIIVPTEYPASIINTVIAMSIADIGVVATDYELDWRDGELISAVDASPAQMGLAVAASKATEDVITKSKLRLAVLEESEFAKLLLDKALSVTSREEGYVYIDRAFNVKGVGPVVLGYTKTKVYAHDKLYALPSLKQVEVKSIEVLDEEQDSVGPGVRIGFAIKGAEAEELKESYALVAEPSHTARRLNMKAIVYPWSDVLQPGSIHIVGAGASVPASFTLKDGAAEVTLSRPLPTLDRYMLVNVNARQRRSRVLGYLVSG
jgi:selenocysteine-specific translation elongation factor